MRLASPRKLQSRSPQPQSCGRSTAARERETLPRKSPSAPDRAVQDWGGTGRALPGPDGSGAGGGAGSGDVKPLQKCEGTVGTTGAWCISRETRNSQCGRHPLPKGLLNCTEREDDGDAPGAVADLTRPGSGPTKSTHVGTYIPEVLQVGLANYTKPTQQESTNSRKCTRDQTTPYAPSSM